MTIDHHYLYAEGIACSGKFWEDGHILWICLTLQTFKATFHTWFLIPSIQLFNMKLMPGPLERGSRHPTLEKLISGRFLVCWRFGLVGDCIRQTHHWALSTADTQMSHALYCSEHFPAVDRLLTFLLLNSAQWSKWQIQLRQKERHFWDIIYDLQASESGFRYIFWGSGTSGRDVWRKSHSVWVVGTTETLRPLWLYSGLRFASRWKWRQIPGKAAD